MLQLSKPTMATSSGVLSPIFLSAPRTDTVRSLDGMKKASAPHSSLSAINLTRSSAVTPSGTVLMWAKSLSPSSSIAFR